MVKAVRFRHYGGIGVLRVEDVELRKPAADEVLGFGAAIVTFSAGLDYTGTGESITDSARARSVASRLDHRAGEVRTRLAPGGYRTVAS